MAIDERWYFTKEQLANTPSRRCGIDADKELSYRQQAAYFIQDMGQRLVVPQLCINTAIVYMHRFYVLHSLTQFHRNAIAVAALFLAAKVEEQPRKLEHVIKMAYICLHRDQAPPDSRSEKFLEQAHNLIFNENVLLQTLGFDVTIDHPHTHVVRCCQLVKASKDLAQTSYFMASNSLHLTTMCLQYKPTVVACFCVYLACRWSNWEIPQSIKGRQWFWYVDRTVTEDLFQQLLNEFLHIFNKCPSRLKRKIMSISANQSPSIHHPSLPNSPFDAESCRIQSPATLDGAAAAVVAHLNRSHHTVEDAVAVHLSHSHHAEEGTVGAPAAAAAHSNRSHHVTDDIGSTSTAATAHSSRSHHMTDGAVAHPSRSHHATDATCAASATAVHSSRSHYTVDCAAAATVAASHAQQEKQDEKKIGATTGPSKATVIDYQEYREKKKRECLKQEKAAAAIGYHPNKSHHLHHKPISNAGMPNKHQMLSVQKGTSLHNHHHQPDVKVSQPVQRHSIGSQPNRDPNRQRLPREHGAGVANTSAGITHSLHSHFNLDSSSSESVPHRSDSGAVQDSASSHSSLQEKMSNNHRQNALDSKHQAHDKRLYRGKDPRLKSAKYADMNRINNQRRKVETLEQRCEEVRKLIEKPLPPPKQTDLPYLMNAQQKQQSHHAKYNQQQQDKGNSFTGEMKHAATVNQNALPQGISPSASSLQKPTPIKTKMYSQHSAQGVSQILKDTIKNSSSQSCLSTLNNVDNTKSEKRSNVYEEFVDRNSVDVERSNFHTPPDKHRLLLSPETPITPRESHAQGARPLATQRVHQEQLQSQQQKHQLQSVQHSLMDHQLPVTTQCLSIAGDNITPIASTVDISVFSKNISPQGTVLKIKIPKERHKGIDSVPSSSPAQPPMMQGPLKIKIHTDGISRSSTTAPPPSMLSNGLSGSSYLQLYESSANETTGRKRERVETIGDSPASGNLPPTKKQSSLPATGYGQGHRPGEQQNGRHYNSGSNNKVRGRGVRQHHGSRGSSLHHAVTDRQLPASHYQREIYGNGRGSRDQHHQAPYNSHHPAIRGDAAGYARGTDHADQSTDSSFYSNYHTSVFNTSVWYGYDPVYQQYCQQFHQQSQYSVYPTGNNLIMTPNGTINTSVPPPPLLSNYLYQNQNTIRSAASTRQEDTQLSPPPLHLSPSLPPLPNEPPPLPPPPPPPPPPPSMSE